MNFQERSQRSDGEDNNGLRVSELIFADVPDRRLPVNRQHRCGAVCCVTESDLQHEGVKEKSYFVRRGGDEDTGIIQGLEPLDSFFNQKCRVVSTRRWLLIIL